MRDAAPPTGTGTMPAERKRSQESGGAARRMSNRVGAPMSARGPALRTASRRTVVNCSACI
jgi:hypothetical protein